MEERVLAERYRLERRVGGGGMAEVYRAVDQVLDRTVAVKLMHEQLAGDPTWSERFRREARAAAALYSRHIVTVYDWGTDGVDFIVMELVEGEDLGSLIRREGPLPTERVSRIGYEVADALAEAHSKGVIHRDVTPGNILIATDGSAMVADFGIASMGSSVLTQTGSVLGSAAYVSPEQAQGLGATAASDIYSLGVVLFEAATGRLPFEADSAMAVAYKHVNEQPPMPHDVAPDVDGRLDEIIGRAMQKAPEDRYASAAEMRETLRGLLAPTSPGAVPPLPVSGRETREIPKTAVMQQAEPAVAPATASAPEDGDRTPGRRRLFGGIAVWVLLAALLIALGLNVSRCQPGEERSGDIVTVPVVTGMDVESATERLEAAALEVADVETKPDEAEPGTVISQEPAQSSEVEAGSDVALTVSSGPTDVIVPSVIGMKEDAARSAITEAGFDPSRQDPRYSSSVTAGEVMEQDPKPGEAAQPGTKVRYVVSGGPEPSRSQEDESSSDEPKDKAKGQGKAKGKNKD